MRRLSQGGETVLNADLFEEIMKFGYQEVHRIIAARAEKYRDLGMSIDERIVYNTQQGRLNFPINDFPDVESCFQELSREAIRSPIPTVTLLITLPVSFFSAVKYKQLNNKGYVPVVCDVRRRIRGRRVFLTTRLVQKKFELFAPNSQERIPTFLIQLRTADEFLESGEGIELAFENDEKVLQDSFEQMIHALRVKIQRVVEEKIQSFTFRSEELSPSFNQEERRMEVLCALIYTTSQRLPPSECYTQIFYEVNVAIPQSFFKLMCVFRVVVICEQLYLL